MDKYKLSKIFISALNSELSELYFKGMRNAINMNASPDGDNEEYYRKEKEFEKEFNITFRGAWPELPNWERAWTRLYPIKNERDREIMMRAYNKVMRKLLLFYIRARFSGKTPREATLEVKEILKGYYADPLLA
jgi:hypothetical protein